MDKEYRFILEKALDKFDADEDDLLNWRIFQRLMEATDRHVWNLDEWLEVQGFVVEAIRTALAEED